MTLKALLIRFALIYIAIAVVIGVGLTLFDIKGNSGVNIAALIGAVMWSCMSFANKNQRYFTPEEKKQAVIGMVAIDLLIQLLGVFLISAATGVAMPFGIAAIAFLVIGVLHAIAVYIFVGLAGRQYAKQLEHRAKIESRS